MSRASILVLLSAVVLLLFVLELVRSRRLREEYAWLWLLSAGVYLVVTLRANIGSWITNLFGVQDGTSLFVFLGLYFLVLISIQYSIRLSRLTTQNKDLAQQVAIHDSELRRLSEKAGGNGTRGRDGEGRRRTDSPEALAHQIIEMQERLQALTMAAGGDEQAVLAVQEGARAERPDR